MEREKSQSRILSLPVLSGGPAQTILVVLLVISAYLIGSLKTKVEILEDRSSLVPSQVTAPQAPAPQPQSLPEKAPDVPKVTKDDKVRGDRDAPIALIEYSDLECPFCKRFHPTAQQVVDEYKGKVMWVYRHFPLSFHQNAQKEAEASECAYELGGNDGFWKYVDAIFERTEAGGTGFAVDKLTPLAKELGLDEAKFQECLDSGRYTKKIAEEMDAGSKAGVTGTPGNILLNVKTGDTRLIPGAVPFEQVKESIDQMVAEL